jgi:hypothetical protein
MSSNVRESIRLPTEASQNQGISDEMSRFPLWFNRDTNGALVAPQELLPYTSGKKFLSTKQVPSALILRFAGSTSVRGNREELLKSGFTLTEQSQEDGLYTQRDLTARRTAGLPTYSASLSSMLIECSETNDIINQKGLEDQTSDCESSGSEAEYDPEQFETVPGRNILMRKDNRYKVKYDDPWKIQAGAVIGELKGSGPEIIVWSGDGIRLQDPLPGRLLGGSWTGSARNSVRFQAIADCSVKLHVIYSHTHWGRALVEMCNDPSDVYRTAWARNLRIRINRFIKGKTDNHFSRRQLSEIFVDPYEKKDLKARSERLFELLKTVDGIFTQRYLCYPEEVWTWKRFDVFTLGNISNLIGDEFLDGRLTPFGASLDTAYSQLKGFRKWFKEIGHANTLRTTLVVGLQAQPNWCMQFVNVYKRFELSTGQRREYLLGVLSQTRGCGTPPPLVILQAKQKFLLTISSEPKPDTPTNRALRLAALDEVLASIPQEAFTGLATKSRVTVTTSSCWEQTRREGGTTEEIRRILLTAELGDQIPVRDLDTGQVLKYVSPENFNTTGELIFWTCLDHVLRTPLEDLKTAFLTVVKEPGKARSVTKARTCLKIVLDLVSKICSEPLKKGIRSSKSGMSQSNHGWNLFLRLNSQELEDMVYHLDDREETPYEGHVERTDTFAPLYVSSTDYKEATDCLRHYVAKDLGGAWMLKCGIPKLLRAIVHNTCFAARKVYFHATGVLETLGTKAPEMGENTNFVTLRQGVLMGDPLTKPILHLVNVVNRHIGSRLHDADFYNHFTNANAAREAFQGQMSSL